jgi:hypothetical protein
LLLLLPCCWLLTLQRSLQPAAAAAAAGAEDSTCGAVSWAVGKVQVLLAAVSWTPAAGSLHRQLRRPQQLLRRPFLGVHGEQAALGAVGGCLHRQPLLADRCSRVCWTGSPHAPLLLIYQGLLLLLLLVVAVVVSGSLRQLQVRHKVNVRPREQGAPLEVVWAGTTLGGLDSDG